MRLKLPFFLDPRFHDKSIEGATIVSILLGEECDRFKKRKRDFLVKSGLLLGPFFLVGMLSLFNAWPVVTISCGFALLGLSAYQYSRFSELKPDRQITALGQTYRKLSLHPFEDGCIALDGHGGTEKIAFEYAFLPPEALERLHRLGQILNELHGENRSPKQMAVSERISDFGLPPRLQEETQNVLTEMTQILASSPKKSLTLPLKNPSSKLVSQILAMLPNTIPCNGEALPHWSDKRSDDEFFADFQAFFQFVTQDRQQSLEKTLKEVQEKVSQNLEIHLAMLDGGDFDEFQTQFMDHCFKQGFNYYCPKCNPTHDSNELLSRHMTLDENTRMVHAEDGQLQCLLCGESQDEPVPLLKIMDELILPLDSLSMTAGDNGHGQAANGANGSPSMFPDDEILISPEYRQAIVERQEKFREFGRLLGPQFSQNRIKKIRDRIEAGKRHFESEIQRLISKRDTESRRVGEYKVDVNLPDKLNVFIPFYLVKFTGKNNKDEVEIFSPIRLEPESTGRLRFRPVTQEVFAALEQDMKKIGPDLFGSGQNTATRKVSTIELIEMMQKNTNPVLSAEGREELVQFLQNNYRG